MGQPIAKLSAVAVKAAANSKNSKVKKYGDGGGLWLVVTPSAVSASRPASWVFRFQRHGKVREMGLGSYPAVTLELARKAATAARGLLAMDLDPIAERDSKAVAVAPKIEIKTFQQVAESFIAAQAPGWRNPKHAAQWPSTLKVYVYPTIGDLPVGDVTTSHVVEILSPIWLAKHTTAKRVRERIEAILSAAKALGLRQGENAALWRGHLENLLPRYTGLVRHHPALPYPEIGAFMERLRGIEDATAMVMEFLILCACRTSEVLEATWAEFDLDNAVWTIPARRTKANRPHRVPLSSRALAIAKEMAVVREGEFIFPGRRSKRPLSSMALLMLLRRMKRDDLTAHGFRSTFRDWISECTAYPNEVAEMALAHAVEGKVEGAYRRGDLFGKRRALMEDWATYCGTPTAGKVIPIRTTQAK